MQVQIMVENMHIIEIKNNLVKVSYNAAQENLVLSGFVVIKDENQSFIAQIMHLEANSKGNSAILKLVFNVDSQGIVTNYNGSIPNSKSEVEIIASQEILELLPIQNPVVVGELAQQNTNLVLDMGLLEEKLLVCCEKVEDGNIFIKNIQAQLEHNNKKLLVFDLLGDLNISENKIVAGEDFKLPLNYETINFIYEKGLDDANAESKALIQDVFLEVQNYVKTLADKFIPFELFKNVVDEQYEELGLVELVLLKNKLLKYYEAGVFAQEKKEFHSLKKALNNSETTVLDLSQMDENIQREIISYAYSQLDGDTYVVVNVTNKNSDKKLLKQIFMTKSIHSIVICPYAYKYLLELKQLSRNFVLFQPIQQQNDFASYNTLLNKLNAEEFIVYGFATNHLPFVVTLNDLPQTTFETVQEIEEVVQEPAQESIQEFVGEEIQSGEDLVEIEEDFPEAYQAPPEIIEDLDEQIKKDVDAFYTKPKSEVVQEIQHEEFNEDVSLDDVILTEDDLDFIDDLNLVQDSQNVHDASEEQEEPTDFLIPDDEEPTEFLQQIEESEEEEYSQGFQQEKDEEGEEGEEGEEENIIQPQNSPFESFNQVMQQESQGAVPNEEADILPASVASTPIVPIYSANVEPSENASTETFEQGDTVAHAKYGKGTVEKLISYGSKTLCSINFDNVGRRLLDPTLAEIKKVL